MDNTRPMSLRSRIGCLPVDLQERVWRTYYQTHVVSELTKRRVYVTYEDVQGEWHSFWFLNDNGLVFNRFYEMRYNICVLHADNHLRYSIPSGSCTSHPMVGSNSFFTFCGVDSRVTKYDAATGEVAWTTSVLSHWSVGSFVCEPDHHGGIYVIYEDLDSDYHVLYYRMMYLNGVDGSVERSCVVCEACKGLVVKVRVDIENRVYIACVDRHLHSIIEARAPDGSLLWNSEWVNENALDLHVTEDQIVLLVEEKGFYVYDKCDGKLWNTGSAPGNVKNWGFVPNETRMFGVSRDDLEEPYYWTLDLNPKRQRRPFPRTPVVEAEVRQFDLDQSYLGVLRNPVDGVVVGYDPGDLGNGKIVTIKV